MDKEKINYTIESLLSLVDSGKLPDLLSDQIQVILAAINDWPSQVNSLDHFLDLISQSVGNDLTKITIEKHSLRLNPSVDAWEMEALTHLMCLFAYHHSGKSLGDIIFKIKKDLAAFY